MIQFCDSRKKTSIHVVNFRSRAVGNSLHRPARTPARRGAARRNLPCRNLKGFKRKKYYEYLPEGSSCACVIPRSAIRRALEKFRAGRRSLRAALSLVLTHAPFASRLPLVSYFYYPLGFIFMYLLFCISLPLFLKVAFPPFLEGSDTISTAENSGYVSLCIIHYSVDPEGCRISNKCCHCVLPSFRRPMFANSHTPIVLYASLYPLPLSRRYLDSTWRRYCVTLLSKIQPFFHDVVWHPCKFVISFTFSLPYWHFFLYTIYI